MTIALSCSRTLLVALGKPGDEPAKDSLVMHIFGNYSGCWPKCPGIQWIRLVLCSAAAVLRRQHGGAILSLWPAELLGLGAQEIYDGTWDVSSSLHFCTFFQPALLTPRAKSLSFSVVTHAFLL